MELTDIEERALGARLYWAVEVASVPVAETGVSGGLSLAAPCTTTMRHFLTGVEFGAGAVT